MLGNRRSGPSALQKAAPQPNVRRKIAGIEAERERLIAEMAMLGNTSGRLTRPLETARSLLRRSWAGANWREREKLIKAAGWLVSLECQREK